MIGAKLAIDEALLANRCTFNRTNEEPTREMERSREAKNIRQMKLLELSSSLEIAAMGDWRSAKL